MILELFLIVLSFLLMWVTATFAMIYEYPNWRHDYPYHAYFNGTCGSYPSEFSVPNVLDVDELVREKVKR